MLGSPCLPFAGASAASVGHAMPTSSSPPLNCLATLRASLEIPSCPFSTVVGTCAGHDGDAGCAMKASMVGGARDAGLPRTGTTGRHHHHHHHCRLIIARGT